MDDAETRLSPRANRILDVTRELLLRHGSRAVTIAEVAKLANVGKGTLYLYWATKEELVIELFVHDFLAAGEGIIGQLADAPRKVLPHALFPILHQTKLKHPFIVAAQSQDHELLRLVEGNPSLRTLKDTIGFRPLLERGLSVLREHGLVRDDLELGQQVFGSLAILNGFFQLPHIHGYSAPPPASEIDAAAVLGTVSRLFLEPDRPADDAAVTAAAESVRAFMTGSLAAAAGRLLLSPRRAAGSAAA